MSFDINLFAQQQSLALWPWTASQVDTTVAAELPPTLESNPATDLDVDVYDKCSKQAAALDTLWFRLEGLRRTLPPGDHAHILVTIEAMQAVASTLRELARQSRTYKDRIPAVSHHLDIVLPCLERTVSDMAALYEDKTLTPTQRWRNMYHSIKNETGLLLLPQRFVMYTQFLTALQEMLIRSPSFDFNILHNLCTYVLKLRALRHIRFFM